jgi:hypothetical protein
MRLAKAFIKRARDRLNAGNARAASRLELTNNGFVLMNKGHSRAVPLCVRIPHLCTQLSNFVFLLVAIAVR